MAVAPDYPSLLIAMAEKYERDSAVMMNHIIGLTLLYCGRIEMVYDAESLRRLGQGVEVKTSLTEDGMIRVQVVTTQTGRAIPLNEETPNHG